MVQLKAGIYAHPAHTVEIKEGGRFNVICIDNTYDLFFHPDGTFDGTGTDLGGPAMAQPGAVVDEPEADQEEPPEDPEE